jgi:hypothetical protein
LEKNKSALYTSAVVHNASQHFRLCNSTIRDYFLKV